jgi:hypothetical protein
MKNVIREDFVSLLQRGKVAFTFQKKDGTKRDAIGTLHSDHLPPMPTDPVLLAEAEKKAADAARANPLTVRFWDLDVKGFRAVNLDTMLTEPVLVEEFT